MHPYQVAEFNFNNIIQYSINQTSIFTNYGYHQRFDSLKLNWAKNLVAQNFVYRLLKIHKDMKLKLVETKKWKNRQANKFQKKNSNI